MKTRHSIARKLQLLVLLAVVISCLAVAFISITLFSKSFQVWIKNDLGTTGQGAFATLEEWEASLASSAKVMAVHPDLQQAVADDNLVKLNKIVDPQIRDIDADCVFITDTMGRIIYSSVASSFNRRTDTLPSIKTALKGKKRRFHTGIQFHFLRSLCFRAGLPRHDAYWNCNNGIQPC